MPWRIRHSGQWAGALALGLFCLAAPAHAGSELGAGDGSGADNQRLLPNIYPANPVALETGPVPEPYDPFFDVDWSVALRGTYTNSGDEERFDTRLVPSVSLSHVGSRSAIGADAEAELTRADEGQVDVTALRLNLSGTYALDRETLATAGANFSLTQDLPGTPGVASDIAESPQIMSGGVDVGVTRKFGRFNLGVTGAVQRTVYGETTYVGGSIVDNADRAVWALDSGLRLGFQVTPIFEIFGRAGLGRDMFDRPSSVLLIKTDASEASIEAGVTGRWGSVWEATASTGLNLRRFDEASLGEVVTHLYDARVSFTPDDRWRFTGALSTSVEPPGPTSGGTTAVRYAANAEVAYAVNSWLALRANADWSTTSYEGSPESKDGNGYGLGVDYRLGPHTTLSADYGFSHSDSTTEGVEDSHRIMVGVTVSR